jgi:CRISPR-associated protein Csd1
MILQALKGYYDRKAADPDSGIAPEGWEWKEIPFVVVLDNQGKFIQIEDCREGKRGKRFLTPQGVKKTLGITANLLWDTANYALGIVNIAGLNVVERERKLSRADEQKKTFINRIKNELPDTPRKLAILRFLSSIDLTLLEKTPQ